MSEADHNYEGHTFARDEEDADVAGHIRRPHSLNEDAGPSSDIKAVESDIEDDGPDVEGHGHTYAGHTVHGHTLNGPSES